MSTALSVFKLGVQSVRQLQLHTTEVSFKMTGLPYQWTPMANHSTSIARQSSARQCCSVFNVYSLPVSHPKWIEIWRLKISARLFSSQNHTLITCSLLKMCIEGQIVIILECSHILLWNLQTVAWIGLCKHCQFGKKNLLQIPDISFPPRDAMLALVFATATCLSVCQSRAGIVSISSLSGNHTTLVFWCQISSRHSKGFPRSGASNKGVHGG